MFFMSSWLQDSLNRLLLQTQNKDQIGLDLSNGASTNLLIFFQKRLIFWMEISEWWQFLLGQSSFYGKQYRFLPSQFFSWCYFLWLFTMCFIDINVYCSKVSLIWDIFILYIVVHFYLQRNVPNSADCSLHLDLGHRASLGPTFAWNVVPLQIYF